jgi:hypothetical protein
MAGISETAIANGRLLKAGGFVGRFTAKLAPVWWLSAAPSRRKWRFAGRFFGCRWPPARASSFIFSRSRAFALAYRARGGVARPACLFLRARSGSRFFPLRALRGFCRRIFGGLADSAGRGACPRQDQDRHARRLYRGNGLSTERRALSFADSLRRRACAGTDSVPGSLVHAPSAAFRGRHLRAPKGQALARAFPAAMISRGTPGLRGSARSAMCWAASRLSHLRNHPGSQPRR